MQHESWTALEREEPRRRLTGRLVGVGAGLLGLLVALAAGGLEAALPQLLSRASAATVSGEVLFEGKRIATGWLELVPQMVPADMPLTEGRAAIHNGSFAVGEALSPGRYLVRIRSAVVVTNGTQVESDRNDGLPSSSPRESPAPLISVRENEQNHFVIRLK